MNSEEIVVKNEPVYDDKPCGSPIRPSTQQQADSNAPKTSSKRSKSIRQSSIKSEQKEVQVKQEPSTDDELSTESSHKCKICKMRFVNLSSLNKHALIHSDEESDIESKEEEDKNEESTDTSSSDVNYEESDDESSNESSHKCKICKMRFANLRSLNNHARNHSDEEDKNSDIESKEDEIKSEPTDLRMYRIKQKIIKALECIEQDAMKRRNQTMLKGSITYLRHTDKPDKQEEQVEPQMADNRSSKTRSKRAKKIK